MDMRHYTRELVTPPIFLVLSAFVALIPEAKFFAMALLFAVVLQMVLAITGRKGLFLLGCVGLGVGVLYMLWQEPLIWNMGWAATIFLSLFLGYEMIAPMHSMFQARDAAQKELERDVLLWKSRFETLGEKITSDKELKESELQKLHQVIEQKQKEMEALRVLITLSHKETRRAEALLESQQEALRQRQVINESLQTKKTTKQPISLKDLVKKVKEG